MTTIMIIGERGMSTGAGDSTKLKHKRLEGRTPNGPGAPFAQLGVQGTGSSSKGLLRRRPGWAVCRDVRKG